MTTCRDIITAGLRFARILPSGRAPKAAEAEDGMFVLQGMYDAMVNSGTFGTMTDVLAVEDMTAEPWQRIRVEGAYTVALPNVVDTTYPPYDLSLIQIIDPPTVHTWLYEAMRGDWVDLSNLTLDSQAPLATRGQHGLASLFAVRFAETFGADIPPTIVRNAMEFNGSLINNIASDNAKTAPEYL